MHLNAFHLAVENGHFEIMNILFILVSNMTVKFGLAPLSNKHLSDSSLPCLAAAKDKEWLLLSTAFTLQKIIKENSKKYLEMNWVTS
jgi:hypothetical protein